VTRAGAYAYRDLVTVVPVTTRIRGIPAEVLVGTDDGLDRECVANADVLTTIPKRCLSRRLGALKESKSRELDDALRYSLGLG
jgi:mRNA interferase MazF